MTGIRHHWRLGLLDPPRAHGLYRRCRCTPSYFPLCRRPATYWRWMPA